MRDASAGAARCGVPDLEKPILTTNAREPGPAPVCRANLSTLILHQLRDYVVAQGLVDGDRLPPERELAARLSVSRPTLRSALQWLSQRGALRRVQGGGTFLQPNFLSVLVDVPGYGGAAGPPLAAVVETRLILEPLLIQMAAERAGTAELDGLKAAVVRSAQKIDNPDAWRQHDLHFHLRLARLSGNAVLADTVKSLFPQVVAVWAEHADKIDMAKCYADHQAMVDAIARRDAQGAALLMRRHLETFERAAGTRPLRFSA